MTHTMAQQEGCVGDCGVFPQMRPRTRLMTPALPSISIRGLDRTILEKSEFMIYENNTQTALEDGTTLVLIFQFH